MARRERILVADRNPRFLESTRTILEREGYAVELAGSFAAARRALEEFDPDVALVGVHLPGGDGFAFCRHLKEVVDPTIPCVLLFSREDRETVTSCLRVGAENYLLRPLKRRELLSCVRSMALVHRLKGEMASISVTGRRPAPTLAEGTGIRDPRTRFYTFGYFKEALYVEVKRARRYQYPLGVLLIAYDTGPLEAIRAGVDQPDSALDELYGGLALAVRKSLRDTDVPVSYTPENVLILMPHTGIDGSLAVAKRIRAVIKRSAFEAGGRTWTPTISMGLSASSGAEKTSFSALVKDAMGALQYAARKGGNRIVY